MKIYLVRHGETVWNSEKRYQGNKDSPLNAKGKAQAEEIGEFLKDKRLEKIYSSPLGRAITTAKIISQKTLTEVEIDPLLKEINYGDFEGKIRSEVEKLYPEEMQKRAKNKYDYKPPNGESFAEMDEKRIKPFIKKILERHQDNSNITIVSHAGTNKMIIKNLFNLQPKQAVEILHPQNIVYIIDYHKGLLSKKPKIENYCIEKKQITEGYITQKDI